MTNLELHWLLSVMAGAAHTTKSSFSAVGAEMREVSDSEDTQSIKRGDARKLFTRVVAHSIAVRPHNHESVRAEIVTKSSWVLWAG